MRTSSQAPRVLAVAALCWVLVLLDHRVRNVEQLDLGVYRAGALRLLDGLPLYEQPWGDLPFTYPPFAALCMVPLAVLPGWAAALAMPALSCVALVLLWRCCPTTSSAALAALAPLSLLLEPVWMTLLFGQVNLLLVAMVLADLAGPDHRWRGVLTGVAAGIKLTPLVFVGYLVVTGQWRALRRCLLTFVATVAVGFVLVPGDAWRFWTRVLVDAERVGTPWYATNQSVMGVLSRLGGEAVWVRPTWFVLASAVALTCLWLARRLWLRGEVLAAVSATGLAAVLASPVSWSHHWVWALPSAVALGRRRGATVAVVWLTPFLLAPFLSLPHGGDLELGWTWQHLPGDAYVWSGLVWLVLMAWPRRAVSGVRALASLARARAAVRSGTPSLRTMWETCTRMVPLDRNSLAATSRSVSPPASRWRISCSRGVSRARSEEGSSVCASRLPSSRPRSGWSQAISSSLCRSA